MKLGPITLPGPNFIKLLSKKYCLTDRHQPQQCELNVTWASNMELLSNTILLLASFCAYSLYEIGPSTVTYFIVLKSHPLIVESFAVATCVLL